MNNLKRAFAELRKEGYFAYQNFMCCQSCAWGEIPDELSEKVVFYHAQDNDDKKAGRPFFLAWAGNAPYITRVLNKYGIETKWSGDENERILVTKW